MVTVRVTVTAMVMRSHRTGVKMELCGTTRAAAPTEAPMPRYMRPGYHRGHGDSIGLAIAIGRVSWLSTSRRLISPTSGRAYVVQTVAQRVVYRVVHGLTHGVVQRLTRCTLRRRLHLVSNFHGTAARKRGAVRGASGDAAGVHRGRFMGHITPARGRRRSPWPGSLTERSRSRRDGHADGNADGHGRGYVNGGL
jgi:hypothetical protein